MTSPTHSTQVAPWLVVDGAADLLDFLTAVLGAQEVGRAPGPDGRIGHAETRVGETTLVVVDTLEGWSPQPSMLRLEVTGLPDIVEKAVAAGATVVSPHTSLPVGDDVALLADPWGNLWWLTEHVEEVSVPEMIRRLSDPAAAEVVAAYEGGLDAEMRRRS